MTARIGYALSSKNSSDKGVRTGPATETLFR